MHVTLRRTLATFLVASLATGCKGERSAEPVAVKESPPLERSAGEDLAATSTTPGDVAAAPSPEPAAPPPKQEGQFAIQDGKARAKPVASGVGPGGGGASYGVLGHGSGTGVGYGVGSGRMGAPMAPRPPRPMDSPDPQGSEDYQHYDANKM